MTRPATALLGSAILAAASAVMGAGAGACGYDWAVRDAPVRTDARGDGDTAADANSPDGSADDGSIDGADVRDGSRDGNADAPDPCQVLSKALADARDAGQACVQGAIPAPCQTKLIDECGCNRYLGVAGSSEAKRYENAIAQFKTSGCPKDCPSFCPLTTGTCVLSPPHCNP